ncbi:MAG: GNAT family N-acetyltransferase [Lagierella massiliensis]|nr:GNAT family N-acetyltransferase [Lagierella massiliensis]
MEVKEIKTIEEFENCFKDIVYLWDKCEEKEIFYSPQFLKQYLRSFKDENILYLLMYHNNRPSLLAPLKIVTRKISFFNWKELKFGLEGDFKNFILDNSLNNEDTLLKNIFKYIEKLDVDRISLDNILPKTSLSKYILKNQKYSFSFYHQNMVPELDFREYENFKEFEKNFPANTRKYKNKLLREVDVKFEIVDDITEEFYDEIKKVHIAEKNYLKQAGRTKRYSIYEDRKREDFIKNIQLNSKSVRVFILRDLQTGKIIVYRNCYISDDKLISWNTAYDPKYSKYSLSNGIFYFMFKELFKNNLHDKFNFGVGGYAWKFGYATGFDNIFILDYFKSEKGKRISKLINIKKALEDN